MEVEQVSVEVEPASTEVERAPDAVHREEMQVEESKKRRRKARGMTPRQYQQGHPLAPSPTCSYSRLVEGKATGGRDPCNWGSLQSHA